MFKSIFPEKKILADMKLMDDGYHIAKYVFDAGADIVMGHHPHVVQGFEMYKGKPVFYSLGNFIFTTSNYGICNKTVLATVRIGSQNNIESIHVVPGMIKSGRPFPMDEKQGSEFIESLNKLNINFKLH
jgi:poly-gamma-glutamate synthesis protein (capsule biosynthesis protein)